MKTNKTKLIVFALLITFVFFMTACQGQPEEPAPATDEAPAEPTNAPVEEPSVEEEPTEAPNDEVISLNFDPTIGELAFDAAYLFETLPDFNGDPFLAASGEVSDDELDYIFELNTGVLFQDGTLMDADAVIANFNRWFDPENEFHGNGDYTAWEALFDGFKGDLNADGQPLSAFDGIEKVNDITVLIHLNRPVPELMTGLSDPAFSILSPSALANGEFVGTGPYQVSEVTGTSLILTPFADYWRGAASEGLTIDVK